MHQVLSFQTARGFGESSEFVTKRMCFSFLFSVGFLCLLGGFLLGRFASERAAEVRAARTRLDLESTDHLRQLLRRLLSEGPPPLPAPPTSGPEDVPRIESIFSGFEFLGRLTRANSCVTATVRGTREPDRFVVLSASGDGAAVAVKLVTTLERISVDYDWKPRRTLIFCVFAGSSDRCRESLPFYVRSRVLAYLALHGRNLQGQPIVVAASSNKYPKAKSGGLPPVGMTFVLLSENGELIVSGSEMVRASVLEAADDLRSLQDSLRRRGFYLPRLRTDMPHAVFAFLTDQNGTRVGDEDGRSDRTRWATMAQIVGTSLWSLSESLTLKWDPKLLNDGIDDVLRDENPLASREARENLRRAVTNLIVNLERINYRVDTTEKSKVLDVRMINDLLMELDRVLLCPEKDFSSGTDLAWFYLSSQKSPSSYSSRFDKMQLCFELANVMLETV
ncbi:uncharacterized protein LOC105702398 isoform X5 [Orussus abietinus]|uniref:uncharacterized protein LOC105702398 isoform X5 n=1 Tax=Orussus abietinus TaxID=222816 RepID=UPI0006252563|nr:uncharacterized protein LOC105702398 isoform X5 [Orussus abietinus]